MWWRGWAGRWPCPECARVADFAHGPLLICLAVPQTYTESEPASPKDLTMNDSQLPSQSQDDDESCLASPIALEDLALSDSRRPSRGFASPGALDASQSRRTVEFYKDDYEEDVTAALLEYSHPMACPLEATVCLEIAEVEDLSLTQGSIRMAVHHRRMGGYPPPPRHPAPPDQSDHSGKKRNLQ